MEDRGRTSIIAEIIRDHISLDGLDQFQIQTGVNKDDFVIVTPSDFSGEVFAVDGSNAILCSYFTANVNLIRAGYAVYRKSEWQRTVITFDDLFLADPKLSRTNFAPYLNHFFGLDGIDLKESDLDRLSSYYREMQEYVAINDALSASQPGDIILFDGSFEVFEPLRDVLATIFSRASKKGVFILAVAKSSSLSWGKDVTLPFVQHTSMAGSRFLPGVAWYLSLKDKKIEAGQGRWDGQTYIVRFCGDSEYAFRVDAPAYIGDEMRVILEKLMDHCCSAECQGYPHALFRAHRDIRITEEERVAAREELMAELSDFGMSHQEIRMIIQDYHDILEMRTRF